MSEPEPPPPPPLQPPPEPVGELPRARIKKHRWAWMYWLIPLGAAALCFWFVYRDYLATGPTITIYFRDASGLQVNNTPLRFRGAEVGRVKDLELTKDGNYVAVSAQLSGSAAELARTGTVFWIVRPELRLGSITGLRTIVSGEYITMQPGDGPPARQFMAVERAPLAEESGALEIVLLSDDLGSLREQSPVMYRGIQVGQVIRYQLGPDSKQVMARARIRAEYAPLVRRNTVFWNAGGLNIRFGLFRGAEVSADSPITFLTGGVEFATPSNIEDRAENGSTFRLFEKPRDEWKTWSPSIALHLSEQAPASKVQRQLEPADKTEEPETAPPK